MNNGEIIIPARATHPGEILREELRERGIGQEEFARKIDMETFVFDDFINGRRDFDEKFAKKLENHLGIPYTIWMNLQNGYNEDVKAIEERNSQKLKEDKGGQ
jgi:HTH-type transcriptional regulator / antitoxin HigA